MNQGLSFDAVHMAARGHWPEIWTALGVTNIPKLGRHGPCPGCGGKDRFRLLPDDIQQGRWICGQGGSPTGGDGFDLLRHALGWSKGESLKAVAEYHGITTTPKDRQRARQAARKAERQRLESELAHELRCLLIGINDRLTNREQLAKNPHWEPLPEDIHREQLAARRIVSGIGKLYREEACHAA